MTVLWSVLMTAYIGLVLYGGWTDARTLRIPNWVSLSLLTLFIPTALVAGVPLEGVMWHFVVGIAVLGIGIALFAFGLLGGGDAKLLAACALWVGWPTVTWFVVDVVLVGGVLSLAVIGLRKGLGMWPEWLVKSAKGLFEANKAIPYGIAIAAGAVAVMPRMSMFPPDWRDILNLIMG